MSAVALQPIHDLRASLTLTPDLAVWVCAVEDGAEPPERLPPAVVTEAQRLAERADRLMAPASNTTIRQWLVPLVGHYGAAKGVVSEEASSIWAATVVEIAMRGMPVGVFTAANLSELMAASVVYGKLPTADLLMEVLGPDRDKLETRARALRAVAAAARIGRGC